jgi:hypothetical protein
MEKWEIAGSKALAGQLKKQKADNHSHLSLMHFFYLSKLEVMLVPKLVN